jgi:cytochrome c553
LVGKSEAQLIQALKDFKSGKRDSAVMTGMASPLSDQDIENIAAYYASLK